MNLTNQYGFYRFTLNDDIIDVYTTPWETGLVWTNRNLEDYSVTHIGRDTNGFYYKYSYYTYDANNVKRVAYSGKQYWKQSTSGDFVIDIAPYTYPQDVKSIPDNVANYCVEFIGIEYILEYDGMTATMTTGHSEGSPIPLYFGDYFEIVLTPKDNYRFIDSDVPVIITCPDYENGGLKEFICTNTEPNTNNHTITEIQQDGKVHIYVLIGAQYYQLSYYGYRQVRIGDVTGILIKNEYDVQLNLSDNLIPSNDSSVAPSNVAYTNTLSVPEGYVIDDDTIVVTMAGETLSNVYNPVTHTITIPQVYGDIIINGSSVEIPHVTNALTNCSTNNSATTTGYKEPYTATITADTEYSLEDASVLIMMGDEELYDVYNNGVITIPSVTANLTITIVANEIKTFTFKSSDGQTTYATIQAVKVKSILFTLRGNTRTLVVNGETYTWTELIPSHKQLVGLDFDPNSSIYTIPMDSQVELNYYVAFTMYEVIVDEDVTGDKVNILLYKNSAENNRVDKGEYLQFITHIAGVLKTACSILNPLLLIDYPSVIDFNYIYIPMWKRYYFVTNIEYGIKNLVSIYLKVDVLMSHKKEIRQQTGLVARNEQVFNEYLVDSERIIQDNPIIERVQVTTPIFEQTNPNIIVLNIIGGK